jgi:hypothetical protein
MRFAARRVVVDDVPRGLVDVEAPFPVATEAEQQQQQPEEREVSLAAVSPEPASSEQLASRSSGSRSSAVRSLSPLAAALCVFVRCSWCIRCATSFMILRRIALFLSFLLSIWVAWHGDHSSVGNFL